MFGIVLGIIKDIERDMVFFFKGLRIWVRRRDESIYIIFGEGY